MQENAYQLANFIFDQNFELSHLFYEFDALPLAMILSISSDTSTVDSVYSGRRQEKQSAITWLYVEAEEDTKHTTLPTQNRCTWFARDSCVEKRI